MKIKPQYFVLIMLFFIGGVFGMLYLNDSTLQSLFSRSLDVETVSEEVGAEPRPAIESLDGQSGVGEIVNNNEELIKELQKELLETQNDPDMAIELRRRIQILQSGQTLPTSPVDTPSSQDV